MFEKDSAVFYEVQMAKKKQVLLTEVPASAHPVETLGISRLCRINSDGLMPTAKQNSSKKGASILTPVEAGRHSHSSAKQGGKPATSSLLLR